MHQRRTDGKVKITYCPVTGEQNSLEIVLSGRDRNRFLKDRFTYTLSLCAKTDS